MLLEWFINIYLDGKIKKIAATKYTAVYNSIKNTFAICIQNPTVREESIFYMLLK